MKNIFILRMGIWNCLRPREKDMEQPGSVATTFTVYEMISLVWIAGCIIMGAISAQFMGLTISNIVMAAKHIKLMRRSKPRAESPTHKWRGNYSSKHFLWGISARK